MNKEEVECIPFFHCNIVCLPFLKAKGNTTYVSRFMRLFTRLLKDRRYVVGGHFEFVFGFFDPIYDSVASLINNITELVNSDSCGL